MSKRPASVWRSTIDAARTHITAQGEVIYANNLLQDSFFQTFALVVALERADKWGAQLRFHDHALALWHVLQSDRQQRQMAVTAISSIPSTKVKMKRAIASLEWARKRADKLADYRNLVAHNPIMFSLAKNKRGKYYFAPAFGGHGTKPIHRQRLAAMKGLGFWRAVRDDLLKLSAYVADVNKSVAALEGQNRNIELVGAPKTWPDRPRLRSHHLIQRVEMALTKADLSTKRAARRRSLARKR